MVDTSFLFGSNVPTSITSDTAEQAGLPAWLQDYTRGLIGQATTVAGEAQPLYTGDRLAAQTNNQLQANQNVSNMQGSWQPALNFASQTAPNQVGNYMNPYTAGVTDEIARLGTRNLTENLLPNVNSTFTGAGQFGSTRNADFTNRAVRDANESIIGAQANALNTGYQQAVGNFQNDATRIGNVGDMATRLGYQDVGMLSQVGQGQQAQDQQILDRNYANFTEQANYPKQQLEFLSNMLRGTSATSTAYPSTSTVAPVQNLSPLQQAAAGFMGTRSILGQPAQTAAK